MALTNYFGQFLPFQWNTGKFSADSAEPSAQDPLCFFTVGRVATVRDKTIKKVFPCFQNTKDGDAGTPEVCHSLVVVFMSTEAAAEEQREQDDQQEGDQASRCDHPHPLVRL